MRALATVDLTAPIQAPNGLLQNTARSCISWSRGESSSARFARLAEEWRRAVEPISSIRQMVLHPAYQQIIGMGADAVPFILRELQITPDHWFWALNMITGEDPVQEKDRGSLPKMTEDWLSWGKEKGLV
jgi:hypothetical protein